MKMKRILFETDTYLNFSFDDDDDDGVMRCVSHFIWQFLSHLIETYVSKANSMYFDTCQSQRLCADV